MCFVTKKKNKCNRNEIIPKKRKSVSAKEILQIIDSSDVIDLKAKRFYYIIIV